MNDKEEFDKMISCDCENATMIWIKVDTPPDMVEFWGKTQKVPYWICNDCGRKEEADPTDFIPSGDYVMPSGNIVGI